MARRLLVIPFGTFDNSTCVGGICDGPSLPWALLPHRRPNTLAASSQVGPGGGRNLKGHDNAYLKRDNQTVSGLHGL